MNLREQLELNGDFLTEAAKGTPPAIVTGLHLLGITLQDWVLIATLGYIVVQAAYLIWKWRRESKREGRS